MDLYITCFLPSFCPYLLYPPETLSRCGKDWPVRDIDECLRRVGAGSVLVWLGGTKSPGRPGGGEGRQSAQVRAWIIRIGESRAFNYAFMLIPGKSRSVRFVAGTLILFWGHPSSQTLKSRYSEPQIATVVAD